MAKAHDAAPAPSKLSPQVFALLWFASLKEIAHQEQIVKNLLIAGSLVVFYGDSNSGKTYFILDMGLSLAGGRLWRGRATKRGLVVYVAGEGAASVRMRVAAYREANPDIEGGLPFAIVPQAVNFLSQESIDTLIETIRTAESECGEKAVLVVVDTFARALPGGDENSAQDVGQAVAGADLVRTETGACVIFIHHCGKDGSKGARGSSALRAATDTEILIEGQTGQRTATVTKQRDLATGERMPFELVPVAIGLDPDDGTPINACVVRHSAAAVIEQPTVKPYPKGKQQLAVLRLFEAEHRTGKPVTPSGEIARLARERLGMPKSSAFSAIQGLTQSGWIKLSVGGLALAEEPETT